MNRTKLVQGLHSIPGPFTRPYGWSSWKFHIVYKFGHVFFFCIEYDNLYDDIANMIIYVKPETIYNEPNKHDQIYKQYYGINELSNEVGLIKDLREIKSHIAEHGSFLINIETSTHYFEITFNEIDCRIPSIDISGWLKSDDVIMQTPNQKHSDEDVLLFIKWRLDQIFGKKGYYEE